MPLIILKNHKNDEIHLKQLKQANQMLNTQILNLQKNQLLSLNYQKNQEKFTTFN